MELETHSCIRDGQNRVMVQPYRAVHGGSSKLKVVQSDLKLFSAHGKNREEEEEFRTFVFRGQRGAVREATVGGIQRVPGCTSALTCIARP